MIKGLNLITVIGFHKERNKMIREKYILDCMASARGLGSSEQCYDIMYSIVRAFQVETILEIGTNRGYSSIIMTQAVLDNKKVPVIHTVDQWVNNGKEIYDTKQIAKNNIRSCGLDKFIFMYEGDSKVVVPEIFSKIDKVDLCFIDGDHSIKGVMTDFNNCRNNCDLMLLHDTGQGKIGYLDSIKSWGYNVTTFPTHYVEGDNHLVGITLVQKIK